MEFKGTKGKWMVSKLVPAVVSDTEDTSGFSDHTGHTDIDYYGGLLICESIWKKEDALLISKAPEMLEMLKKVLDVNEHHGFNGHSINRQIEKLIKEATEL